MTWTRIRTLLLLCTVAMALGASPSAQAAEAPVPTAKVNVKVVVNKFVVDGTRITALGQATANVGGAVQQRAVRLSVSRTLTCSVLALNLKELRLQLLGLHVDVGTINLTIKGDPRRSLGALFCKLSRAISLQSVTQTRAAATSLNRSISGKPLPVVGFSSAFSRATATAAATSCKVLDLTLGPLHLDLVGLIVDLYGPTSTQPVEVHVSADPAGGVLGSTFCRLATTA